MGKGIWLQRLEGPKFEVCPDYASRDKGTSPVYLLLKMHGDLRPSSTKRRAILGSYSYASLR
jgi:hypothetical protein